VGSGFTTSQNVKENRIKECELVKPDPKDYSAKVSHRSVVSLGVNLVTDWFKRRNTR